MRVTVTIDDRGGITLPADLLRELDLKTGDSLILEVIPDGILLRRESETLYEVYSEERIREFASDEEEIGKILPGIG